MVLEAARQEREARETVTRDGDSWLFWSCDRVMSAQFSEKELEDMQRKVRIF